MISKVAVVGLGIMGRPMAANLLKAGCEVTVYNRSGKKADEFVEAHGGRRAAGPAEAARNAEVVITMVGDSSDVEAVVLGPGGVAEGAARGSVVIDMSTISPAVTRRIAAELGERGVEMLDAPVSGGEPGAVAGTLTIMVGGKAEVFERCRPVFEALGKTINHMGPSGAGQLTKLVNQIICSDTLLAVCEGLLFASKAGLDVQKVVAALSGGSAQSAMLTAMAPKIIGRDFRPGFFVMHERKDLRLVLEAAQELGLALPGTGLVQQLYNALEGEPGAATQSHALLVRALEKLAGWEVGR
jgi:3-hydroxyisobutyrate dehydrogenase